MKALLWLSLFAAAPAAATPTYLVCTFPGPQGNIDLNVTVDEENSTVTTYLAKTGHTEKMTGVFTPTQVLFHDDMLTYVLSRTDLSISRTIVMIKSTDTGTCKVITPPKRAF